MFLLCIFKISNLPFLSGTGNSISLSNLPARLNAWSTLLGLLVAAMTITLPLFFKPSISVSNCDTVLLSTSPVTSSLFGAIASISSMKMMLGAFFSASSKIFLKFSSVWPYHLEKISGPLIDMKFAPDSFATAFASKVFPVPGGPYNRTPCGGSIPNFSNSSGCLKGNSIISLTLCIISFIPPTSS